MVLSTVFTALFALRALSSASFALSDAWSRKQSAHHAGHHHVRRRFGLLAVQFLLGVVQLLHHGRHLPVQSGGFFQSLLCVLLRLRRALRKNHMFGWHSPPYQRQQEGPLVSAGGSDVAPRPLPPSAVGLATGGPDPLLSDCIEPVRRTILNARAPSTRIQYENSAASACRVFWLAAMMVALMAGIFFRASSAAVLLSFTLRSKSAGREEEEGRRKR
ncbi:hypothetical protein F7725_010855 [Dissostichus mawsoni]|uniref:Transmembrane protein n=1 Tax=Dissostichus mawsoni TaxID=36200 RepID=A0A7J5Z769_DISMA|nr:hypothetical protein F7725_010855 [Dissostichus mawsoni]